MAYTLRKLLSLPHSTRLRKLVQIFDPRQTDPSRTYLESLLPHLEFDPGPWPQDPRELPWYFQRIQTQLLETLGQSWADWEAQSPKDLSQEVPRRPLKLYAQDIRSPFNLGSLFRTAEAFGFEEILLSAGCPDPNHPRCRRSSMGCVDRIPWRRWDLEALEGPVFALELGGTPLNQFPFPAQGTVLVGSEELGLSPRALDLAAKSLGRVTIPLTGTKASLNLVVAFGILASAWTQAVT